MAADDYFLKIDGIEGESEDPKHKGEIELLSFRWSEQLLDTQVREGTGAVTVARWVTMSDFEFTMLTNKASPKLLLAVASVQHIKSAVLTGTRAGADQQPFLTYTFSDLLVSSYKTEASVQDEPPVDEVSFNFGQIQVEYRPQQPDGTLGPPIQIGWDVKGNRAI
jgi:type VI secretion system secreted protein Hcp